MIRVWPSTSRAEDAAVLALLDLTRAAAGITYRVIGGNPQALGHVSGDDRVVDCPAEQPADRPHKPRRGATCTRQPTDESASRPRVRAVRTAA